MAQSKQSSTRTKKSTSWRKRLVDIFPFSQAQEDFFRYYEKGYNLVLSGAAGCGKTFIALHHALNESKEHQYRKKVIIVRSVVPTRDMGFLPGTQKEKEAAYTTPYENIVNELYGDSKVWETLVDQGTIQFMTTSYIRGITLNNSIVIVDEMQNCNFHELDSVITRIGEESRIIFAGDYYQSDFTRDRDRQGINKFLTILEKMNYFRHIRFEWEDICRSGIVRDYIMTKELEEKQESSTYEEWSPGE
jgi:phosphate starvation-inducible protein PhoH